AERGTGLVQWASAAGTARRPTGRSGDREDVVNLSGSGTTAPAANRYRRPCRPRADQAGSIGVRGGVVRPHYGGAHTEEGPAAMTAGYDPGDPAVHDATAPPQDPSDTGRLGPRPPRFGPSPGPSTGSYPTVPPAGPYGPGPGSPAAPRTGPIPVPGFAPQGPPGPPGAGRPAPPSAPRRGGRLGVVAFILALLLLPVVGVQAAMIMNLSSRLDASQRNAASAR